jgi:hypothetical protein
MKGSFKIYFVLCVISALILPDYIWAQTHRRLSMRDLGVINFKILSVKGDVSFARPLSGEFRNARNDQIISDGSLLRVGEDSSVMLQAEDNLGREGLGIRRSRVTINVPIILRMSRESFRRIQVNPKMMTQFNSKIKKSAEEKEDILRKMSEAWRQAAAILSPDSKLDEETLKQIVAALNKGKKIEEVGVSVEHGKIDFLSPGDKQLLLTDRVPYEMKIIWQREKAPLQDLMDYEVYFWRQGESRQKIGIAKGNRYAVSVKKTGKYFMQVKSTDGLYKSKIEAIEVQMSKKVFKGNPRLSDKGHNDAIALTMSRRIKSLAPDRNLIWHGNGSWPIFEFEWSKPEICSEKVVYEFIVTDKRKKQVYKRTLNIETHQWSPDKNFFGVLFWEARVVGCMGSDKKAIDLKVATVPRRLELVRSSPAELIFSNINKARFNGTLFFESF